MKQKWSSGNCTLIQYRGNEPHDHSKLLKVLQTSLLAERLPDLVDESLRKDVTQFMKESAARSRNLSVGQLGQDEVGKAETDGKVLGSICAAGEFAPARIRRIPWCS